MFQAVSSAHPAFYLFKSVRWRLWTRLNILFYMFPSSLILIWNFRLGASHWINGIVDLEHAENFFKVSSKSAYSTMRELVFPGTVVARSCFRVSVFPCFRVFEARFLYFWSGCHHKDIFERWKSLVPLSFSKYTEVTLAPMEGRGALILRRFTLTLSILPRIAHTQIYWISRETYLWNVLPC
jgi:hypothetical protein